jgi:hypothetical protein
VVDVRAALEPVTVTACLAIGVLSDAESCGHCTAPSNGTPASSTPGSGIDVRLTIGSTDCDSPAGADGIDPATNPGTTSGTGTGTGTGTGVSRASTDGRNDGTGRGGRDVLAALGGAFTVPSPICRALPSSRSPGRRSPAPHLPSSWPDS